MSGNLLRGTSPRKAQRRTLEQPGLAQPLPIAPPAAVLRLDHHCYRDCSIRVETWPPTGCCFAGNPPYCRLRPAQMKGVV